MSDEVLVEENKVEVVHKIYKGKNQEEDFVSYYVKAITTVQEGSDGKEVFKEKEENLDTKVTLNGSIYENDLSEIWYDSTNISPVQAFILRIVTANKIIKVNFEVLDSQVDKKIRKEVVF